MRITHLQPTPNPHALKLVLDGCLLAAGTHWFTEPAAAAAFPVVGALFGVDGVRAVFIGPDFITVSKAAEVAWTPERVAAIAELVTRHAVPVAPGRAPVGGDDLRGRIEAVLAERIRPALAADGGGLQVLGLAGHELLLRFQGACGSCPAAEDGTRRAIEQVLRTEVAPELVVVLEGA